MNTKLTGGPAFPQPDYMTDGSTQTQGDTGMTLRDYFAAKAMQGLIEGADGNLQLDRGAYAAYAYADAMLKAREA